MKDKFPYSGKPAVVTKEMCDMNGHMNCCSLLSYFFRIYGPIS